MRKRNVALSAAFGCALSALVWNLAQGQDAPLPPPNEGGPGGFAGPGGADGPGGFDPQKMQQTFLDRLKETLGATDEEWKVLQPRLEKVMTLLRETSAQGPMGFGPGGPRGGPEAGMGGGPDATSRQPTSEVAKAMQALQNTLGNPNATTDEIMAGLRALRDAREKAKQELAKASAALSELLTLRQEAQLVTMGILD